MTASLSHVGLSLRFAATRAEASRTARTGTNTPSRSRVEAREAAVEVIARYYPLSRVPQKTFYALEEILSAKKR
ncbi:MAG TPA: hypothetical protein VFT98_05925 [Myxococcota bacterium]|nr:hypothetical protein [Myxococcota bacterium]